MTGSALALLQHEIDNDPIPASQRKQAHLFLVAQPLAGRPDMLLNLVSGPHWNSNLAVFMHRAFTPELDAALKGTWARPSLRDACNSYRRARGAARATPDLGAGRRFTPLGGPAEDAVELQVHEDGGMRVYFSRFSDADRRTGEQAIVDMAAIYYTRRFLALVLAASEHAGYFGNWALAIGATGLKGLQAIPGDRPFAPEARYDEDIYTQTTDTTWAELNDCPGTITRRILDDSSEPLKPRTPTTQPSTTQLHEPATRKRRRSWELRPMRPDDFFVEDQHVSHELWGLAGATSRSLDLPLLTALRRGPSEGRDDIEVAVGLARLVHDELEKFGTGGGEELTDHQIRDALVTLHVVLRRVGIPFDLPFRDYGTFKSHWKRNNCTDSYQKRRDMLNELFGPLHDRLVELETRTLSSTLAQPISPHPVTGWARVDAEVAELRRHFQNARTEQDYRNVGNDCVILTEELSRQVYDPKLHLRAGEEEPAVDKTKNRIGRYIEDTVSGPENAELRRLARAAIEFAQRVKHSPTSTRREAGIAADTVILLANILRRLDQPT